MSEEQAQYEVASGYYTPSIDEFHYGFEYEFFDDTDGTWNKVSWDEDSVPDFTNCQKYPFFRRVAYLTHKQIEGEGLLHVDGNSERDIYKLFPNPHTITVFHYCGNLPEFRKHRCTIMIDDQIIFQGKIRNINEFRKLNQMLEIK